jgi:branched-chain amino acid transport system permease protein
MSFSALLGQAVVNGLILGMLYMLVAVGFTLAFGMMRIVNFAHGEFYMVGAYAAFFLVTVWDVPFLWALLAAGVATGLLGAVCERLVFQRFYGDELNGMIVAIGVSVILQNAALMVWGPTARTFQSPFEGVLAVGDMMLSRERLFALACAGVIFLGFWAVMMRTQFGRAVRALAQDREVALMQGVRANRIYPLAFGVAVGLAATAGALMAPIFSVSPYAGVAPMLKAFVVVILGGLGSIPGAVVGGILLGLVESLAGTLLGSTTADVLQLVLVIAILLFRPWGLLGRREREG